MLKKVSQKGIEVTLDRSGAGKAPITSFFHGIWLRDNCRCSECRDSSGQKLRWGIDGDASVHSAAAGGGGSGVEVRFGDGHVAHFSGSFLREYAYDAESRGEREGERRLPPSLLWRGSAELQRVSAGDLHLDFDEVMGGDEGLLRWLRQIDRCGVAFLRGGGDEGAIEALAARLGPIRETFYGRTWHVRAEERAINVAYTARALCPHVDILYYEASPGLQLLHCLRNDAEGGRATFADAFRVAEELRARHPDAFDVLRRVPVAFHFRDAAGTHHMRCRRPLLVTDDEYPDQLVEVNVSPPFEAPLDVAPELVEPFYAAYRQFATLWRDEAFQHCETYEPGLISTFHNRRILHGREAFRGARHLHGTYVDLDHVYDKLRTLSGKFTVYRAGIKEIY